MIKRKRFLYVFILFFLILAGFFIFFEVGFAQDEDKIELKDQDREKIWQAVKQGLSDELTEISTSGDFKIEDQTVLAIIKQAVKVGITNYLLAEVPKEIAIGVIKTTIKLVYSILAGDPALVIGEIEKLSVEKAKEYAMNWLLQKEIKTSSGNLKISYPDYNNIWQKVVFPYIIVYQPLSINKGEVAIEIYSPKTIRTPYPSRDYQWEGGIEELPPFILRIKGEVEKVDIGFGSVYRWVKGPDIKVVFNEPVPEIEFEETGFLSKKVAEYKSDINKIEKALGNFLALFGKSGQVVKEKGEYILDKIGTVFSWLDLFGAKVSPDLGFFEQEGVGQIGQEEEEIEVIEETEEKEIIEEGIGGPEELTLEEAQEILDDIAERIDILSQKVAELVGEPEGIGGPIEPIEELEEGETEDFKEKEEKEDTEKKEGGICVVNINTASKEELQKITGVGPVIAQRIIEARPFSSIYDLIRVSGIGEITLQKIVEQDCAYVEYYGGGGGGGGGTSLTYSKILISEIQISPLTERFIELYNPNNKTIDLTNWYIQRKTQTGSSWNSLISSTKFEGKIIQPYGHFLIARLAENADVVFDLTLTENNTLVLKNPNREIVDKVGWGEAQDYETAPTKNPLAGQSIGRKWINEEYQDINSNQNDFEIQSPTPKAQNQSPELEPEPEQPLLTIFTCPEPQPGIGTYTGCFAIRSAINPDYYSILWFTDEANSHGFSLAGDNPLRVDWYGQVSVGGKVEGISQVYYQSGCDSNFKNCQAEGAYDPSYFNAVFTYFSSQQNPIWSFFTDVYSEINTTRNIVDWNGNLVWTVGQTPTPPVIIVPSQPLPYTYNGHIFNEAISIYHPGSGTTIWYCGNKDYLRVETSKDTGIIFICGSYEHQPGGGMVWCYNEQNCLDLSYYPYFGGDSVNPSYFTSEYVLTSQNLLAKYTEVWNSNGLIETIAGQVILEANIKSGEPFIQEQKPSQTVVINEIAWMGTKANSADEWVELYNNTDQDINLAGWELKSSDGGPDIIFGEIPILATTTISSYEFYLLERTDDNTISDVPADWTGSFGNGLGNNPKCEILSLYDQNDNLIDQTTCLENGDWPAGKNEKIGDDWIRVSMERIDAENWANNNLIMRQGKDAKDNQIWGTPKFKNSVSTSPTEISVPLPFDEFDEITLTLLSSPYIIRWTLDVPQDKILKIEPGVVVKFYGNNSGLTVMGTLKAIGTENEKIIFTSLSDNPQPGSWDQIYFGPTSTGSEMINVIVRYGGGRYIVEAACPWQMAGVWVDQASIILENSIIEHNKRKGVWLNNSSSRIDNVQFIGQVPCEGFYKYEGTGLAINGGDSSVKNSVFRRNRTGIDIGTWTDPENIAHPAVLIIENNIFEENEEAVRVINSHPFFAGNRAENNGINGVLVSGSIVIEDAKLQANLPYIIQTTLEVPENKTLTIEPGVVIKFSERNSRMNVMGTLKAIGEADNEIVFTSLYDDEYGGDTNNDGDASSPVPGSWDQIYFGPTSTGSEMINVIVRYGGGRYIVEAACPWQMAGVWVDQASIILENSIIEYNKRKGVWLDNSSSRIDNVQFIEQVPCEGYFGKYEGTGLAINKGDSSVENSVFKKNVYGISIDNAEPILDNLLFGQAEEANQCNIFKDSQCIDPPTP